MFSQYLLNRKSGKIIENIQELKTVSKNITIWWMVYIHNN